MKKLLTILFILILIPIVGVGLLLGWLSATEFRPAETEKAAVLNAGEGGAVRLGEDYAVMSWNVGYGGLGKESDFFMDGGENSRAADEATVIAYLDGIRETVAREMPDLVLFQEVDIDSSRSYGIDQRSFLDRGMQSETFALNYSCPFVPIPVPPIGRVHSGLFTVTENLRMAEAQRISLPCPFSWPLRIANLKRCLLVSYLPIEGSDRQLVLVNLHLEAYDDGEGKIAQTRQLKSFLDAEYAKGNYVIAGGDFNQAFPGSLERYPNAHPELWEPGVLDDELLPEGWTLAYDLSVPTCRLLNQPYNPGDLAGTQHYVIDGLILSPNVTMKSVKTLDEGFANSDHNPVLVEFALQ